MQEMHSQSESRFSWFVLGEVIVVVSQGCIQTGFASPDELSLWIETLGEAAQVHTGKTVYVRRRNRGANGRRRHWSLGYGHVCLSEIQSDVL